MPIPCQGEVRLPFSNDCRGDFDVDTNVHDADNVTDDDDEDDDDDDNDDEEFKRGRLQITVFGRSNSCCITGRECVWETLDYHFILLGGPTKERSGPVLRGVQRPSRPPPQLLCLVPGNQGSGCLRPDLGQCQHSCRLGFRGGLGSQASVVAGCPVVAHLEHGKTFGQHFQDRHASSRFWGPAVQGSNSVGCPYGFSRRAATFFEFALLNRESRWTVSSGI